jgi:hypothetical protein
MFRRSEEGRKIRKEMMKKGIDYTPFQAKEPVLLQTQTMNTLTGALTKDNLIVLVTPKLINTQFKHTKETLMDTSIMETQQQSTQENSQTLTYLSEDFLAKLSLLLEKDKDLTTPEAHSSLMSLGFYQKKDPDIWFLKMSKGCLLTTKDKLSKQYLPFLPTWGIELNGRFLIAKTSEFPKTEKGSTLSDILEENVDDKYYLSDKAVKHLLAIADKGLGYSAMRSIAHITKDTTASVS